MGSPSMGGGWATTAAPIRKRDDQLLDPGLIGGFASVARPAGLQFRESRSIAPRLRGGETFPPFLSAGKPSGTNGDLVPDAQRRINDGGSPLGFAQAIAAHAKGHRSMRTPWASSNSKSSKADTVRSCESSGSAESHSIFDFEYNALLVAVPVETHH